MQRHKRAQAAGLDFFLRQRIRDWAIGSRGCFVADGDGGDDKLCLVRWEETVRNADLLSRVRWARPKSSRRAVEKLYRCYDRDVSRLLDCCRQV